MWKYGKAELPVQVAQDQTVDVLYALPVLTFVKGAIGFAPVKAPGKLWLVLFILAVVGGALALMIVAALLGG